MKKLNQKMILCTIVICALSFVVTSCSKDGVYKPKEKINRIYYQYSGGGKMLSEKWNWDNNLLSKIDYYYDGEYNYSTRYIYKGKQLIEVNERGYVIKFSYDGAKLTKFESWYNGSLGMSAKVTHDGAKITKIEATYYDGYKANEKIGITALRGILPESTCEHLNTFREKAIKAGNETATILYKYDGNNIKEEKYVSSDGYEDVYTYTYDDKKNPFYHLLYGGDSYTEFEFSKNNIIKWINTETDGYYDEGEFIYSYDDNYPTERYNASSGSTYYYEYD